MVNFKRRFFGSGTPGVTCALAGLAIAASAQVAAQEAAAQAAASPEEIEEVVVSGIRASMRDSLAIKRESIQVVDAISAEDVGDFPDKNIGEAIQRVPGVQINRQDGEGRSVSIRGADQSLIRVELNGVSALSLTVGGGRDVDFRDLPVEFVSRVEVVKTPTAEMTEGGIGTVRVVTRHPFDQPEGYLAGSVQAVYSDLADSTDPKIALIGSKVFLDGTLGVIALDAARVAPYRQQQRAHHGLVATGSDGDRRGATPGRGTDVNADGTLDWIPEIPRYIIDRRETTRQAFNAVIDWRADRRFLAVSRRHLCERARGSQQHAHAARRRGRSHRLCEFLRRSGQHRRSHRAHQQHGVPDGSGVSQHQRPARARAVQRHPRRGLDQRRNWKFDGRVTYARGEVQNDEKNSTATIFGVPRAIIDYTGGEGAPNFSFPGIDTTDGALVNNLAAVFNPRTNDQQEEGARFNVEFNPELDWLTSVKAGVEKRDVTMESLLFARTIQMSSRTPTPASCGRHDDRGSGAIGASPESSMTTREPTMCRSSTPATGIQRRHQVLERQRRPHLRRYHRRERPHHGPVRRQYKSRIPMEHSRITWIPGRSRKRRWPAICRLPSHATTLSCRSARC